MGERLRVGDVRIDEVDLPSLSDAEIETLNAYSNVLRAESHPDDPPRPVELTRANVDNIPPFVALWAFHGLLDDGTIVASAEASYFKGEENKHLLEIGINVLPDRRGNGLGKALLGLIAEIADAEERTLLVGGTSERVPAGDEFAKRVGADAVLRNHTNRLVLSEVDPALLKQWVDEGPVRGAGYTMVATDGPYPDEMVDAIASLHEVMNTAPRDDLDMEDWHLTVEHVRQWEKSMAASGDERWSLFVRHDETGELAGFTEVLWNAKVPKTVHQLATGVRPEHRGHALGKWLKAAMLQRVLAERTASEDLRTGNADSNDPMLGINKQLGFKPYQASTIWQVPMERVRSYLGSST